MTNAGVVIGIDLGGTKIHAAAIDAEGKVLGDARIKTQAEEGAERVIARMAALAREVAGGRVAEVAAVCVGVPGGTNQATGVVDEAPNLGWENVPLAQLLSKELGAAPVFLDNDVRIAVIGEHAFGVGRGTKTMLGVFVGTGVGGGIVVDGKLHTGFRGVAGEIGHMVLDPKGPRCSCGRRGCAEALTSRTAMEKRVRELHRRGHRTRVLKLMKKEEGGRLTSSVIAHALADGDKVMRKVVARAQKHLGLLVGSVCNLLDPEVVVIGGGIAERLGEAFVAPIREAAYERLVVQREREQVRIVPTELKDRAAPLGAAFLARQKLKHGSWLSGAKASAHS